MIFDRKISETSLISPETVSLADYWVDPLSDANYWDLQLLQIQIQLLSHFIITL